MDRRTFGVYIYGELGIYNLFYTDVKLSFIQRRGLAVSTPASYFEDPGLKSQPEDWSF
jgi:hypothetical protein